MKYTHGGDVYRNKIEYDFSININPLGMPEMARRAALDSILLIERYPDYRADTLLEALSKKHNTAKASAALFNGAAELIYLTAAYAANKFGYGYKALTLAPTFTEYEAAVRAYGGSMDYYRLDKADKFDLDDGILAAITKEYKLVFICNPNNPTGRTVDKALMKGLANRCAECGAVLVVDESFIEFLSDAEKLTMVNELDNYNNLLVIRAFTKIYGMPGMRLGYGMSSNPKLLFGIRSLAQPWNTSIPAQSAGLAALEDKEYIESTIKLIEQEREFLYNELSSLAKEVIPGMADYILFRADNALYDRLMKQGIMIRHCDDFVGLSDEYFRIGIRTHSENEELIKRWRREYGNS